MKSLFLKKIEKEIDTWSYEKEVFFKLWIIITTIIIYNIGNSIYTAPLYQEEKIKTLKNIEIFLERENNENKDLILKKLKNKDLNFLKEYYEKKILDI